MSRKRSHRMRLRQADSGRAFGVLLSHQPATEEMVRAVMNLTRAALIRILEGNGSGADLARLGRDINVAWARTEQIGNNAQAQQLLEAAADAIEAGARLLKQHGRVGLTGPGRGALGAAVDLFEEIVKASTPKEMSDAEDVVISTERRIRASSNTEWTGA